MRNIILLLLFGYLCGNFSTGVLAGKIEHVDLRTQGSGNIGATNATRIIGFLKGGLPTMLGDILKAVIPVLIVKYLWFPGLPGESNGFGSTEFYELITGLGVVLGHDFPFWMKFKGGKGIASTGGLILVFSLPMAGILMTIMIVIIGVTRFVSLASITAAFLFPVLTAFFFRGKWVLVLVAACYTVLAWWRHKENIVRLLYGTENKFGRRPTH